MYVFCSKVAENFNCVVQDFNFSSPIAPLVLLFFFVDNLIMSATNVKNTPFISFDKTKDKSVSLRFIV